MTIPAILLGWTTFIEMDFGTPAAGFLVYKTGWFYGLIGILCFNILCAILTRLPLRKKHLPFLLAHLGILILFIGCWMTARQGTEAKFTISEGTQKSLAVASSQWLFSIDLTDKNDPPQMKQGSENSSKNSSDLSGVDQSNNSNSSSTSLTASSDTLKSRNIEIPFSGGPFNWSDYQKENWRKNIIGAKKGSLPHLWGIWLLTQMKKPEIPQKIYEQNGLKIEILDYFTCADFAPACPIQIHWKLTGSDKPEEIEMIYPIDPQSAEPNTASWRGLRKKTAHGERIVYILAESQKEFEGFLASVPKFQSEKDSTKKDPPRETLLLACGKDVFQFSLKDLKLPAPLGATGYKIVDFRMTPTLVSELETLQGWTAVIRLANSAGKTEEIQIHSEITERNVFCKEFGITGTLWMEQDPAQEKVRYGRKWDESLGKPRLELIQSPDGSLGWRCSNGAQNVCSGKFELKEASEKGTFVSSPVTPPIKNAGIDLFEIKRFRPNDEAGVVLEPTMFKKDLANEFYAKVRLRVTLDGETETFLVRTIPLESGITPQQLEFFTKTIYSSQHRARIKLTNKSVQTGFALYVRKFEPTYEPGSSTPSSFKSIVDYLPDPQYKELGKRENVTIRMNQPGIFYDPLAGRNWHVYQDSFRGPFLPGTPQFDETVAGKLLKDEKVPRGKIYHTVLSINNDPGRGLKYTGSLLIVLGTALLIYKRRKKKLSMNNEELPRSPLSFPRDTSDKKSEKKDPQREIQSISKGNDVKSDIQTEIKSDRSEAAKNSISEKEDFVSKGKKFFILFFVMLFSILFSGEQSVKGAENATDNWSTWRRLPVFDEGRIMPLNTFAKLAVKEICGSAHPILRPDFELLKKMEGAEPLNFPSFDEYCRTSGQDYSEEEKRKLADWYKEAQAQALDSQHQAATRIRRIFADGSRKFDSVEILFSWLAEPDVWDYIPFLYDEEGSVSNILKGKNSEIVKGKSAFIAPAQLDRNENYSKLMDSILSDKAEEFRTEADWKRSDQEKLSTARVEARYSRYRALAFNPQNSPSPIVRFYLDKILYPSEEEKSDSLVGQLDYSIRRLEAFLRMEKSDREKTPFDDPDFLFAQKTRMSGKESGNREVLLIAKLLVQVAGSVQNYPLLMNCRLFDRLYGDFVKAHQRLTDHQKDVLSKEKFSVQYRQELLRVCSLSERLLTTLEQAYLGLVETGSYEIHKRNDKSRIEKQELSQGTQSIRALPPARLNFNVDGTIRLLPLISSLQGSPDEEQSLPWTSLQMVVYGPDEIYRRFVNPKFPTSETSDGKREAGLSPLRTEASAFQKAVDVWRGLSFNQDGSVKDNSQGQKEFFSALDDFVKAIRTTAEQTQTLRKEMLLHRLGGNVNDKETAALIFKKIDYPLPGQLDAEILYYQLDPFFWMWFFCLTALVFLIPSGLLEIRRRLKQTISSADQKSDSPKEDKASKRTKTSIRKKGTEKRKENRKTESPKELRSSDLSSPRDFSSPENSSNQIGKSVGRAEIVLFYFGLFFLILSSAVTFSGGVIRAWITGWAPVTNMFETVVLLVFLLSCFSIVFVFLPIFKEPLGHAWQLSSFWHRDQQQDEKRIRTILFLPRILLMILTAYFTIWICYHEFAVGKSIFTALEESLVRQSILDRFAVGTTLFLLVWLIPRFLVSLLIAVFFPKKVFLASEKTNNSRLWERKLWPMIGAVSALAIGYWAYTNTTEFNPNIRPLVAVLRSNFWLTIHVFAIIISYALGTLAWCVSLVMLAVYLFGHYRNGSDPEYCEKLEPMLLGLLQSAVLFLTAGTLLGARWADFSWGRFWSWDPKEVWALVTLLIYLVILHGRKARYYGRFGLTIGAVAGAFAIIMTWYGLSFVFGGGGRHAYVSGQSTKTMILCALLITNVLLMIPPAIVYRIKHRPSSIHQISTDPSEKL